MNRFKVNQSLSSPSGYGGRRYLAIITKRTPKTVTFEEYFYGRVYTKCCPIYSDDNSEYMLTEAREHRYPAPGAMLPNVLRRQ